MVAVTTLYGPTEMIDGGFLWVKRCWALAMARGALLRGISWFMLHSGMSQRLLNFWGLRGAILNQSMRRKEGAHEGNLHILTRCQFLEIPLSPLIGLLLLLFDFAWLTALTSVIHLSLAK